MKANIKIAILTEVTNLDETLAVLVKNDWWDIQIQSNELSATSRKQYDVPERDWSGEKDMDLDSKLHRKIDGVVAHIRDTSYMSFGLTLKWGYEAWYGHTHATDTLDIFPSIHQEGTSTQYNLNDLDTERAIFKDVGTTKDPSARTMLGYWRRADELSELSFHSEAYLNYFKVLECLETLSANSETRMTIIDKFAPNPPGAKDRVPIPKIKKHIGRELSDGSIVKHIIKAATILSSAGYDINVSTDLFIHVLDLINVRNHYNVAHHLLREIKNDWFIGVGQHSDEFERVIPDLNSMKQLSKMMILNYLNHGVYQYSGKEHKWSIRKSE